MDNAETAQALEALLQEERLFPPSPEFAVGAHVNSDEPYRKAAEDRLAFWAEQADKRLTWFRKWDKVLDWSAEPFPKWFTGGRLNVSFNCIDRHLAGWRRNKAAIIWEGEPGDQRVLTYNDLRREVGRFANVLKSLGVRKGDRVTLYLPMIPELPIAMLACARIGAPHSVVFGGFSSEALRDRINDAQSEVVVTADGGWRKGGIIPLKQNTDDAVVQCPSVKHVVVVRRVGDAANIHIHEGRDHWWHRLMQEASAKCDPEPMDSEDPLFILYTSGSTGKPKGVLHTTGGYLTHVATTCEWIFDLKEDDTYWCTADIGWVTGHSYIVYGPLVNGATSLMYEGAPDWPHRGRNWEIIEKHRVSILYTAPTAIRTFMRWGPQWPGKHDLSSLRLLGTVGEPINPEAWMWYHRHIGKERCPIVDTWWQTETGGILITPLPGYLATKPGSATRPFPGIEAEVLDGSGKPVPEGGAGYLVIKSPWPGMLRTIYGDPERYRQTYWSRFPGVYFTGDGAKKDKDGYFWLMGRVDDVINVSGHRIGTMEVESALVDHPAVAEAAVIGRPHEIKGQAVAAFVTLKLGIDATSTLKSEIKDHVVRKIGALARPDEIYFTGDLPKTRSGKIMRRLLRDIAEGKVLGDTTTLADPSVIAKLKETHDESDA